MKPTIIERARAYLARMPVSVSGQGGHAAAFNAALVLVKGFSLGAQDAFALLAEWNTQCLPPWNEADLRHKIRDAAASSKTDGYLLGKVNDMPPTRPQRGYSAPVESEADRKARKRENWPEFYHLNIDRISSVARQRGIKPDAVDLAHRFGLLKGALVDGHGCYILHEGPFAQARRFDGKPFIIGGQERKAKNLPGSEGGAFIGKNLLGNARHVLLTEGCVGLLEGLASLLPLYTTTAEPWTVLAATSASSRFSRDPELLRRLAGRHVRIVPDNNDAGMKGAASWLADLMAAGIEADARALPKEYADLGEALTDPWVNDQIIESLFQ